VPSLDTHVWEWLRETEPAEKSAAAACVVWAWRVAAATPAAAIAAATRAIGTAMRGLNMVGEPPEVVVSPCGSRGGQVLVHVRRT
jgi:hypothetical protein